MFDELEVNDFENLLIEVYVLSLAGRPILCANKKWENPNIIGIGD